MLETWRSNLPAKMADYPSQHPDIEPATCFSHPPTPNFDTPTEQDWEAREPQQEGAEQLSRAGNETEDVQPSGPDSKKEGVIIMQGDVATTETIDIASVAKNTIPVAGLFHTRLAAYYIHLQIAPDMPDT
jgi:hypothetical protein